MKFTCINNILALMWNKDSFKRKPISKHNTNITKVDFECEIIFVLKMNYGFFAPLPVRPLARPGSR